MKKLLLLSTLAIASLAMAQTAPQFSQMPQLQQNQINYTALTAADKQVYLTHQLALMQLQQKGAAIVAANNQAVIQAEITALQTPSN